MEKTAKLGDTPHLMFVFIQYLFFQHRIPYIQWFVNVSHSNNHLWASLWVYDIKKDRRRK